MISKLRIFKSIIANVLGALTTFLLGVLLARQLGPGGFGQYSFVLSVAFLATALCQLGMPVLIVRLVASYSKKNQRSRISGLVNWAANCCAICSIFTALLLLALDLTSHHFGEAIELSIGVLLIPLLTILSLRMSLLRGLNLVIQAAYIEPISRNILLLLFCGICIALKIDFTVNLVLSLYIVGLLLVLFSVDFGPIGRLSHSYRSMTPEYEVGAWLKESIPLLFITVAQLVLTQSDIILLGVFSSPEELGPYRAMVMLALCVQFFSIAINSLAAPMVASDFSKGDLAGVQATVGRASTFGLYLSMPVLLIFLIFGHEILLKAFGEEFVSNYEVLVILCFGYSAIFSLGPTTMILNMTGHQVDVLKMLGVFALLNVIMNIILIPAFGGMGAAIATSLSYLCFHGVQCLFVINRLGIDPIPKPMKIQSYWDGYNRQ